VNHRSREAILAALKAARDIADAAESAGRDLTEDERAQVTVHLQKAAELKTAADADAKLRADLASLGDGIGVDDAPREPAKATDHKPVKGSIGKAFTDSAEFKALISSVPNGRFGEKARVQSQPFGLKALVTGVDDASAGSLIVNDRLGLLPATYERPLTVRQLVTNGTTQTDAIDYVQINTTTNNAATVAEATSSALPTQNQTTGALINNAGGGYKPESAMTFTKATTNVKTIAHWMPATKRALSDASQIRTLIDNFLLYGLEEELEDQIIGGNGTGENFQGITTLSGIQTVTTGADAFEKTRKARRMVRIGGRATPSAYVLNPIDWEAIELLRDTTGRFMGNGPFQMTTPTLWGLPVVESEAVAAGTAWCADWRQAVLWDREQASIQVTDSHADFFVRNLVAILAELRAAFAVLRPAAFVKITL